jgi:hypothetical protein
MRVIERIEGHYEAQEVEFGRVYRWTPETVVIDCDCRERLLLTGFATTCKGCGADRTLHPWRYARDRVGSGIPY